MARSFLGVFPYYGSKSKIARHYPKPRYDTIIEPFGGSGSYSLLHYNKRVIINELNKDVYNVWKFLQHKDAIKWIDRIPKQLQSGESLQENIPEGAPEGLVQLLKAFSSIGNFGKNQDIFTVSPYAARDWWRIREKLKHSLPKIKNWTITNRDYRKLLNRKACYFVDPPYHGVPGAKYKFNFKPKDYRLLAEWCKLRKGQVIVCESGDADYMAFKVLKTTNVGYHKGKHINTKEVFCELQDGKYYRGIRKFIEQ